MRKWKIWYDDGSTSEGVTEEDWDKLPRHGVLLVNFFREKDRVVHMGFDYYWYEEGQVKSCQRVDFDRYLERPLGIKCVKFGRWGADNIWIKAHDEACATRK